MKETTKACTCYREYECHAYSLSPAFVQLAKKPTDSTGYLFNSAFTSSYVKLCIYLVHNLSVNTAIWPLYPKQSPNKYIRLVWKYYADFFLKSLFEVTYD